MSISFVDSLFFFPWLLYKRLMKDMFEVARYPGNCTEDDEWIEDPSSGCFALQWPRQKERDEYYPFEVNPLYSNSLSLRSALFLETTQVPLFFPVNLISLKSFFSFIAAL